ncbi:BTAD domain-containing putative transcriptional regulator [Micromonospora sp. DT44]|uniref:AfsR/SARP family transcriptional regulator n=1 Tax=Micromonospora sp. DT44 TaxID=3393439 RepID=UPI003CE6A78E
MADRSVSTGPAEMLDGLLLAGDIDAARSALDENAAGSAAVHPGWSWRAGLLHYLLRGSPTEALEVMSRGRLGDERTADEALLLGWLASAYWALGDVAACTDHAIRADVAARVAGDARSRAGAHVALALAAMLTGDRMGNAAHYAKALRFAEAAADTIQVIRIRMNLASQQMEEARFAGALNDLTRAVALAERVGNDVLLAIALANEGESLKALGRFDEAQERLQRSIDLCERSESGRVCFALISQGDLLYRRGQQALARSAYEQAVRVAQRRGQVQILAAALAGLAEVLVPMDTTTAMRLAERAGDLAVGPTRTVAALALSRVVAARGDRIAAGEHAARAQALARTHRDRIGVARALELQAENSGEWPTSARYLAEARRIWVDIGAVVDADRITIALARLPSTSPDGYADPTQAAERLAAAGVATQTYTGGDAASTKPAIRTLGRFEVVVGRRPLSPTVWQSRKARDLLRLLVARRGRPTTREELADLLWADDQTADGAKRAHRLAVTLSIVRGALDGAGPTAGSAVLTDGGSVALDTSRVLIDLETFLHQAEQGLRWLRGGRAVEGRALLTAAERLYAGDFLEGDPYDDWASHARELARATYLKVTRALADDAAERRDFGDAIQHLLRCLAVDEYDEQSHLNLTAAYSQAGLHGEARRACTRYAAAMRAIGVEPTGYGCQDSQRSTVGP